jgi:hypothetical protein
MSKPPIFGFIALIKIASLSLSKPTIVEKGKTSLLLCIPLNGSMDNNEKSGFKAISLYFASF